MDYPPLLPNGLHPKTLTELHQVCVAEFPLSQSRASKFAGLRRIVERLAAEGIQGDLWIDGSFLTQKIEPGDIDIALRLEPAFLTQVSTAQTRLLKWFGSGDATIRAEIRRDFSCDSYAFCDIPSGQPGYPGHDMRQYWLNQFGVDRSGAPKGIAVLSILGGVQ